MEPNKSVKLYAKTGFLLIENTPMGTVVSGSIDKEEGEELLRSMGYSGEVKWRVNSWTGCYYTDPNLI